jgi:hypothetical protein
MITKEMLETLRKIPDQATPVHELFFFLPSWIAEQLLILEEIGLIVWSDDSDNTVVRTPAGRLFVQRANL